jgi:hypothetical protein
MDREHDVFLFVGVNTKLAHSELSDGSPQDILGLFGILILCSKYMIIRLRKPILRHLSTMWPSTLAIHDIMVEQALSLDPVQGLSYPFIHPLHVYKLARSINAPSLAPSALYFLSMYPLDADLMEGTHQKLQIKHPALPTTSLILDDILDYTLMYQHRISTLLDFVRTFLPSQTTIFPNCGRSERNVSPGRTPTLQCHKVFKQLESRFSRSWNPRTSPIFMMKQASQAIDADQSVCVSCKRVFRTNIEQLREKTWQDLPGVVGLPDWTQLIATTEEG